ncbi:catalase family peroxidase [Janthinobacterium agaricidamnosum]|uniref:Catalase-related peroxidase n=1 Tax=Janthinobacterium agaricidamnosum NBRC 102515 = DSM 9628 TaxID=1349767 RepID=W0V0I0_9BURK|nr:catalase family peroxidase [Janthinobacterium agaricidamnosum]CDG81100.1 catalase family protein [Janthinobacterium agaricidamnosum NBRC 102515 = DSM 9628]
MHPPPPGPADLVDALNNTFGQHPGKRASHAKGFCASGEFIPADGLSKLVDSPLFGAGPLKAILRFSIGGGNPAASDKSRSVRGLAIRLQGAAEKYDLVLVSEPVFFAATPASFVSFLAARVADPLTKKPDPAKLAAHNAAFPDGLLQASLLASHAAPASYATSAYFSNNAFVFTAADGTRTTARIVVEPAAGTHYLSVDDERSLPDDFLEDELAARLVQGRASFTLYAQLPADGDPLDDPSRPWQGAGRVALGQLHVTALAGSDLCDGLEFVPLILPRGIAPSDDPILLARAAAYAVSLARRSTAPA